MKLVTSNSDIAENFGRTPPHNIEAEMATLGGMLLSRDAIADVMAFLEPGDHYRAAHQVIHETITRLHESGEPADAVTVAADLTQRGEIARTGGHDYLHSLIACVPTAANAAWYARIVQKHAIRRRLIEAGTRVVQAGYEAEDDDDIADRARQFIEEAARTGTASPLRGMPDLVYSVLGEVERGTERGMPLPWGDLTDALNGLAAGQLVYVAARPGIGKSIVGGQIAAHAAVKLGLPALLVSMEMRAEEIVLRLVSAQAKVPLTHLLSRQVSDAEWAQVNKIAGDLADCPLVIDDASSCSLGRIRSRLREMARTAPARLLVVDYIGLLETPAKAENRQNAVAELSRDLKRIAGEFGIPVIALAQLNRASEHRPDKRPALSDLRDSGAQEQDADVVLLLHREDASNSESPRAGEIDVIVAKNRTGPQCIVTLTFQGHYGRVMNMAREDWTPSSALGGQQ